jgi:hypothetical protein
MTTCTGTGTYRQHALVRYDALEYSPHTRNATIFLEEYQTLRIPCSVVPKEREQIMSALLTRFYRTLVYHR